MRRLGVRARSEEAGIRRIVAIVGVLALAAVHGARSAEAPLERVGIAELSARMAAGRLSSEALTRFYLQRIARLDRRGPALHAVLTLNRDAIVQARASDVRRRSGGAVRLLEGVPILIKDNIETQDPMPTTAGSLALANNYAGRDAPLVARLRASGAVILGKTNLSEWANFRSNHATSGWSALGGLVRNPYALDRTACGSSSGSAVAVAAGLAAAAIGSETDGSITCPASMNGVTGFKPTVGLIPRTRVIPIAHSQDTAGPITHNVADARLLAAVMAGPDLDDPASRRTDLAPVAPVAKPASLRGLRLGVLHLPATTFPDVEPVYQQALARLRAAGAVLVEVTLPDNPRLSTAELIVLESEMKVDMDAYLRTAASNVRTRSLADLIAFDGRTPQETRVFGQDLFEASQATHGLDDPAYRTARADEIRIAGAEGLDRLLRDYDLALILSPTSTPAWKADLLYGDVGGASSSSYPAMVGYPHATVPMGLTGRLPVGLSVIGPAGSDDRVLAVAAAWEVLAQPLAPPMFAESVDPFPGP